jgi:hypothetical protein
MEAWENEQTDWDTLYPGMKIVENEDVAVDFNKPVKGKYVCKITKLERRVGTGKDSGKPYDFFTLKMKAVKDVSGDPSNNRFFDKTYSNTDSEWSTAEESLNKLLNDLKTCGALGKCKASKGGIEGIEQIAPMLVDMEVNVSAYPSKNKQTVRIVNQFKAEDEVPQGVKGVDALGF